MTATTFSPDQNDLVDRLQAVASSELADWARRSFDAGRSPDEVKDTIRRAMAVVEAERV